MSSKAFDTAKQVHIALVRAEREIIETLRQLEETTGRRVCDLSISEVDVTEIACPYQQTLRGVSIQLERPIVHRPWRDLLPSNAQEPSA